MAKEKKPEKINEEKEFIIPLRKKYSKVQKYRRASKSVKIIKDFLLKHMKIYDQDPNKIKLDPFLNEYLWQRGIKKPPFKIKVKAKKDDGVVEVKLAEMPEKLKFKKARLDKREKTSQEMAEKKKTTSEKLKEAAQVRPKTQETPEKSDEEKKEEEEKKKAVIESGKEMKKVEAKKAKHSTKTQSKQPKRQKRKALAK